MKEAKIKVREPGEGLRRRKESPELKYSLLSENIKKEIRFLNTEQLQPYAKQARKKFDQEELVSLASTIKEYGITQPLIVLQAAEDLAKFEVISGERRLRAARLAGLNKLPCIILENARLANEIALVENIQRSDLHPIELGEAYSNLITAGICSSGDQVAEKLGAPRSQVFEYIQYAKFPDEIKQKVMENNITSRALLRELKSFSTEEEMTRFLTSIKKEGEKENVTYLKKIKRERKRLSLMKISLEEGRLMKELKGINNCPPEIIPKIIAELQVIISLLEGKIE